MARDRLIFFATDVHGSERCFRKFLAAAAAYGADTLVMGGDITGKIVVPIHPDGAAHVTRWRDTNYRFESAAELEAFQRKLADMGAYGWVVDRDEAAAVLADDGSTEALLVGLTAERVRLWVELADERLDARIQAFAIAGNDDPAEVDLALAGGTRMQLAESRVTWIDDWLPMISYGDSTPTPWDSPREVSEDQYGVRLDGLIGELDDVKHAVFNLHVPPHDSQPDMAPALDEELRVRYSTAGDMMLAPVGSLRPRVHDVPPDPDQRASDAGARDASAGGADDDEAADRSAEPQGRSRHLRDAVGSRCRRGRW